MPRPKNDSLLALFKTNDSDQILCYNGKCDGKVLYKHSANLERHLKLLHPLMHSSYMKNKKFFKFPRKLNFEKRLIDLVREHPILWDKFNEDRFNEDLLIKAWHDISYKMEVTVRTCKERWKNLIEKFKTELIQYPEHLTEVETVNGKQFECKSKWKYFPELLFLHQQIDLTPNHIQTQLDAMQSLELDHVKEESNDSFLLFNETLEGGSSQFEYEARDSVLQDEKEESRQTDETGDSRLQEYRDASESQDNIMKESGTLSVNMIEASSEEDTRKLENDLQFKAQNGTNQHSKRTAEVCDQINVEDEFECFKKMIRTMKDQEVKVKSESDNGLANELDPDRMFLLSLWPFLKAIPDRKKLYVRQRIQGVLLDEQEHL